MAQHYNDENNANTFGANACSGVWKNTYSQSSQLVAYGDCDMTEFTY